MDRLTKYQPTEGGFPYIVFNDYRTGDHWQDALQRLAAYEDTGLEPEEVKSLKETWDLFGGADGVQRVYVERDEYKQAESEGRLIVLPCKVGDTVWSAEPFMDKQIREGHIVQINIGAYGFCGFWASFHPGAVAAEFLKDDIGKTVFLTREEAEAALGGDHPAPEWISVDYNNPETLPCTEKSILYCAFGRSVGEGYYRGFDGVHHVWKMYAVAGTHWDYEVTHWMPLPEPPGGDAT